MQDASRKPRLFASRSVSAPASVGPRVVHVSDASFEREVVRAGLPVLVDFWAPWCGPCKRIGPLLEEIAAEYQGRVKFVKLDTEENPGVTRALGIRSIPTLALFRGKQVVDHRVGTPAKESLRQMLDGALGVRQAGLLSWLVGGRKGRG